MTAYRELLSPPSDQEAAALADLSRRVTWVRLRVTIPSIVLAAAAGFGAAFAHISGYFPAVSTVVEGSYRVSKGSIVLTTLLAVLAVAIPSTLIVRLSHAAAVRGWRIDAKAKFQLDDETVEELARMFAPRKGSSTVDEEP